MMKVRDCLYAYPGLFEPAVAHLRVYEHDTSVVAIVGEVTDNPSTSITSLIEVIVAQLRAEYGRDVIVIEHYPPPEDVAPDASWTSVVAGEDDALRPDWAELSTHDVEALIGEPVAIWPAERYVQAVLLASGTAPA